MDYVGRNTVPFRMCGKLSDRGAVFVRQCNYGGNHTSKTQIRILILDSGDIFKVNLLKKRRVVEKIGC